jgi:serine/threonine-protein kinase RsbW
VHAAYDCEADTLAVTVTDRGQWRQPVPDTPAKQPPYALRGRGIPLMRALADDATIDTTTAGTQVTLTWANLRKPNPTTPVARNT